MTFEDDLKAARAAEIEYIDVPVELNGNLHIFRFLQLSGTEWTKEADKHPLRPGVLIDSQYGYNIRTLALAVGKLSGRIVKDGTLTQPKRDVWVVEGGTPVELTNEQWDELWKTLPGGSVGLLEDAIFLLNEAGPVGKIEALKKASAVAAAAPSA